MRIPFTLLIIFFMLNSVAAQVGIGTTTPSSKSALDISSTTAGVLFPRVTTAQRTAIAPSSTDIGLSVYDTTTKSYWYWDGSVWVQQESVGNWKLNGNGSTTPASNYVGTSDATDLKFSTAGLERIRILANGQIAVNNTGIPLASEQFTVNSSINSITAYTTGASSIGVLGTSTGTSSVGARGISNSATGFGVRATNSNSSGTGLLTNGNGSLSYYNVAGSGAAFSGVSGSVSFSTDAVGWGVLGAGNNILATTTLTGTGGGGAFTGNQWGVYGNAQLSGSTTDKAAFVGQYLNPTAVSTIYVGGIIGGTNYKILGAGTVSTLIPDEEQRPRILFCPEAPEVLFEDYGIGTLKNGVTYIELDPILKKSMKIDEHHPLKVFIQLEGECNGVFVTQKTADGFKVKELNNGTSNTSFSWHIVANRKDVSDQSGVVTSKYENLRLPLGPKELDSIKTETKALKN